MSQAVIEDPLGASSSSVSKNSITPEIDEDQFRKINKKYRTALPIASLCNWQEAERVEKLKNLAKPAKDKQSSSSSSNNTRSDEQSTSDSQDDRSSNDSKDQFASSSPPQTKQKTINTDPLSLAAAEREKATKVTSQPNDAGSSSSHASEAVASSGTKKSAGSSTIRFPVCEEINRLIYLWRGDILQLEVDAITNSTNEPLSDRSGLCGRIFKRAGPDLQLEVERMEGCRTGESKLSRGYNLFARSIIHTVGPRYNIQYKTAAENALHSCYRSCLQLLKENHLKTIAFCVINSEKRGYPRKEGAHIAIRTVRRFLESHREGIDAVVFAMNKDADMSVYQQILPLYFPRDLEEQTYAQSALPRYTGNEVGETVVEARKIRINALLADRSSDSSDDDLYDDGAPLAFARMQGSVDDTILSTVHANRRVTSHTATLYSQYLAKAKQMNLSDMARRNIIFQSGETTLGRPVIVIVGKHFPPSKSYEEMERFFLYVIRTMDNIVEKNYIVVYLHTGLRSAQRPELSWLKKIYNIWDEKYSANLEALYVLHPTFWLRMFWNVLSPFLSTQFSEKVRFVDGLSNLYEAVDHDQLKQLPDFVYAEDLKLHGRAPTQTSHISHSEL
mmetsp:Transcript_19345/g.28834  ORF Transcript_19345/g.28834 Transcript_19345/m.28834 type:complete len:617 (+) Transcript_19345:42-1892(+)